MRTKTKLHIPGSPVNMGDLAKDEITGFEGLVTAHVRHLTGCDTIWLTSKTEEHEGRPVERVFDVLQVLQVESNPMGIKEFPEQVEAAG